MVNQYSLAKEYGWGYERRAVMTRSDVEERPNIATEAASAAPPRSGFSEKRADLEKDGGNESHVDNGPITPNSVPAFNLFSWLWPTSTPEEERGDSRAEPDNPDEPRVSEHQWIEDTNDHPFPYNRAGHSAIHLGPADSPWTHGLFGSWEAPAPFDIFRHTTARGP